MRILNLYDDYRTDLGGDVARLVRLIRREEHEITVLVGVQHSKGGPVPFLRIRVEADPMCDFLWRVQSLIEDLMGDQVRVGRARRVPNRRQV